MTEGTTAPALPLPAAFWRTLAGLVAIDLALGWWLHLHAPQVIPSLSIGNVLLIGASGITGLLPEDWRTNVMRVARESMSRPATARVVWSLLFLALVPLLAFSSVVLRGDGRVARVRVVKGAQGAPMTNADTTSTWINHTQSEKHLLFAVPPFGQRVWAYTDTHVSRNDLTMFPWQPAHWSYPDDFDEMVSLFILPMPTATPELRGNPKLVIRGADGLELLNDHFDPVHGVVVRFRDPPPSRDSPINRWIAEFLRFDARDTAGATAFIRGNWTAPSPRRPSRPLHLGEQVFYEFQYPYGVAGPFPVVLDSAAVDVLLDSSAVHPRVSPKGAAP